MRSKLSNFFVGLAWFVVFIALLLGGAKLVEHAGGHAWLQALCIWPSVLLLQRFETRLARDWKVEVVTALVTYVFLLAFFFVFSDLSPKGLHAVAFVLWAKFAPVARVVKWLEARWLKPGDDGAEAA